MIRINILFPIIAQILFTISVNGQATPKCKINTSIGNITIELYDQQAPVTVANFLQYIDLQLYDSSSFYRVCTPENEKDRTIKIEVVQGGNVPEGKELPPIKIETTKSTGIRHLDGTISMARDKPNSATSSFFICVGDQPELDYQGKRNPDGYGFAAFGRVLEGMEVVQKIQQLKNDNQYLEIPVIINTIERLN